MNYVYPAVFEPDDGLISVSFPDIPDCYTCGNDLADALAMASDVLSGWLCRAEEKGLSIPKASPITGVARDDHAIVTLVLSDTASWRRAHSEKAVKKTLSIPSWLNEAAEERSINFSQVLQDALKDRLGLTHI